VTDSPLSSPRPALGICTCGHLLRDHHIIPKSAARCPEDVAAFGCRIQDCECDHFTPAPSDADGGTPSALSSVERRWLDEFSRAVAGDYNMLTIAIPPRIHNLLIACLGRASDARGGPVP
jgi:hypothetical protein